MLEVNPLRSLQTSAQPAPSIKSWGRFSLQIPPGAAQRASRGLLAVLALLVFSPAALPWGGKVRLQRRYMPGKSIVYQTKMDTHAAIRSNPPDLKSFLPPMPTQLTAAQQNTVTVRAVHPEGTADVEIRFDRFDFHSDLSDRLPEKDRSAARQTERDFSQHIVGQALTAHYDGGGHLVSFEGGDGILEQVDAPVRDPLRQILKLFLEQMGGDSLYPDHEVKPGDEWKKNLASPPNDQFQFATEGESNLRYIGTTKYRGVKAAIVDYRFTNVMKPAFAASGQLGPVASLQAMGVGLDLGIDGQGQGRVLLALDDGRVLQNRLTIHQTLTARLKGPPQKTSPKSEPLTLWVDSETKLEETAEDR